MKSYEKGGQVQNVSSGQRRSLSSQPGSLLMQALSRACAWFPFRSKSGDLRVIMTKGGFLVRPTRTKRSYYMQRLLRRSHLFAFNFRAVFWSCLYTNFCCLSPNANTLPRDTLQLVFGSNNFHLCLRYARMCTYTSPC